MGSKHMQGVMDELCDRLVHARVVLGREMSCQMAGELNVSCDL